MNAGFGDVCDDFCITTRLFLKLDLPLERETVLHFFERIRKEFPKLSKFRRREDGCLILEEDPGAGISRRWLRLEPNSLRFGHFGPPDVATAKAMSDIVLEQAPYHLTFSDIDYDHLEVVFGFDLEYQGNHDELVAETLFADHPLSGFLLGDDARHVIDSQPYFGIGLTEECDLQAYIETKSRTTTFEVRTAEFERQALSVYLTLRKYWLDDQEGSLTDVAASLYDRAVELAAEKVVPLMVSPLAQAIASRL